MILGPRDRKVRVANTLGLSVGPAPRDRMQADLAEAGRDRSAERMDELLVRIGRDQDRQAFVTLFHHFAPRLLSYLLRLGADRAAAEEVIQEVMISVWRKADRFDPAAGAASTWLFTIARNLRIDRLRRERRPEIDPNDPALVPEPVVEAADGGVEAEQQAARLHRAIGTLPPEQADLLRMAYFEDKPHSTIAAERNLPLGTVKSRLRLALVRLRKALGEDE